MNCNYCGQAIAEGSRFCPICGKEVVSLMQPGYSTRINDPAFNKFLKNTNSWAFGFSVVIAIIAVIGFFIAGETSSEMDNPESLFIGFAIGGMFLLIGLGSVLSRKKSKTWDGQVINKKVENKKKRVNYGNDVYRMEPYTLYRVIIQSTDRKKHDIRVENDPTIFDYYQIGDHVRHHAGLNTYEKYDKTGDSMIFCNACSTLNNIQDDYCKRCKCPLLK